jgi:tetratricopeptide (TPR) repeat protein
MFALIVGVVVFIAGAHAQSNPGAKCLSAVDMSPDDRIAGCTAMIDSGPAPLQRLVWAHFRRADAYLKKGEFDLAIADYDQVVQQFPDNVFARMARAYAHCRQENFAASLADYEQVIRLEPQNAAGYLGRASTHMTEGDLDGAIADYGKAMTLHPDNVQAYLGRSAAYRAKDDLDRALADCNKAIGISPEREYGYLCRGNVYRDKVDLDRALSDFDRALQLNPKDLRAPLSIAGIHQSRGEWEPALAGLDQVIRLNPQNAWLYRARGHVRFEANMLPAAIEDLNRSSELNPQSLHTQLWLEIARKRSGQPSQLVDAAKQFQMEKWPAPLVRLFLGEATLDAVLAAADDPIASNKKGRVCETDFYAGEHALAHGATEDALRLLQLAVDGCPKTFVEWSAAKAELRRLDAKP